MSIFCLTLWASLNFRIGERLVLNWLPLTRSSTSDLCAFCSKKMRMITEGVVVSSNSSGNTAVSAKRPSDGSCLQQGKSKVRVPWSLDTCTRSCGTNVRLLPYQHQLDLSLVSLVSSSWSHFQYGRCYNGCYASRKECHRGGPYGGAFTTRTGHHR